MGLYCYWYSIGESNTVESGPGPLQEGGLSHAAHECNKKCNKQTSKSVISCFPESVPKHF